MGIVYSGDVSSEGPSSGVPLPTIPPDEGPSPYIFQVVAALYQRKLVHQKIIIHTYIIQLTSVTDYTVNIKY
jgi:hypothetical protein